MGVGDQFRTASAYDLMFLKIQDRLDKQAVILEKPEERLLICCARTTLDAHISREIQTILTGPLDWSHLIKLADKNRVGPLLCWNLSTYFAESVPAGAREALRERLRAYAARNLSLTSELVKVVRLLDSHGIKVLPLKGPTLAAAAYGNIALRQFGDLDILTFRKDYDTAARILTAVGYSMPWREKRDYSLYKREGNVRLELHRGLSKFDLPLDLNEVWKRLDSVRVAGQDIPILPREELLLYLCVHASKHGWQRLLWISDIAELVRSGDIDWNVVRRQATYFGCRRALFLSLLLASELLEADAPYLDAPEYAQRRDYNPFIADVCNRLSRNQQNNAGTSLEWYTHYLGSKDGTRDRIKVLLYYSRYFYVLRPLRLASAHAVNILRNLGFYRSLGSGNKDHGN